MAYGDLRLGADKRASSKALDFQANKKRTAVAVLFLHFDFEPDV
jgi:hypothetical protein